MNFKFTANFFNYLSFKKKLHKSVKLHFYYSAQKHDDSITRYFSFSKRPFPKNSNIVFT